jgi:toxin ParE1/3/4
MRLRFHAAARAELLQTIAYYESQVPGLGEQFLADVEGRAARLLEHPLSAPIVRGALRRVALQQFPFGLIYRAGTDEIRIIAVAHRRRRPGYWIGRS